MTATSMQRVATSLIAAAMLLALLVVPAAAHVIKVHHPGSGEQIETHRSTQFDVYNEMLGGGWVGGPVGLPGQGEGLVPGGPGGDALMTPSHESGLNTSCESLEANPSAADIRGPGGEDCPHGQ